MQALSDSICLRKWVPTKFHSKRLPRHRIIVVIILVALATGLYFISIALQPPSINSDSGLESHHVIAQPSPTLPMPSKRTYQDKCTHFLNHTSSLTSNHYLNAKHKVQIPEPLFNPSIPKTIHFLHYNKNLENPKYLCAIESAAAKNPLHNVIIHVMNTTSFSLSLQLWRSNLPTNLSDRINVIEINWGTTFRGTPFESWFNRQEYVKSKWIEQNLGNAFRLAHLWKHGGVYLDLDIVSINPVSGMGRSVGMQDSKRLNNAYLSFPSGDAFLEEAMHEFVSGWRGYRWGHQGPELVTRVFNKTCNGNQLDDRQRDICDGLNIAPTVRFFPVKYGERAWLFDPWYQQCDLLAKFADESIGLHWWNKRTAGAKVSNETAVAIVMKRVCPAVFSVFSEDELGIGAGGVIGALEYLKQEKTKF